MRTFLIPALLLANGLVAFASADSIDIRRDDAVRIVFPTDLRADVNRPGDRICAVVDDDALLPKGARLYGRIRSVHMATWRRPASMDMEFYSLEMPSGERHRIEAVPVPINDPHLRRGVNGRLVARYRPGDEGAYTLGGAVGGLIVGEIVHRPITGTLLGSIIGSIAGRENRRQNQELVVSKGERMAAVFARDIDAKGSPETPPSPRFDGPSGWRTNERSHHRAPEREETIEIRLDDQPLTFDSSTIPYREDGVVMVPLDRVAGQLQLDVTRGNDGAITVDAPNGSLQLHLDSPVYHLERGRTGEFRHAVVERDGVVFVPIEAVATIGSGSITVNGRPVARG